MIRVLLVDDESLIRRGLSAILQLESDIEVVGEADTGQLAVKCVEQLQPDVVLMDVRMPMMDGVAATRTITQLFPNTKVLVLTTFAEDTYITEALKYGAMGYLLKGTPSEELIQAIRSVTKGYLQVGPGLAQPVMSQLPSIQSPPKELQDLTPREREILKCIAAGASNKEIGKQLCIAEKTVKNHITSILSQLGVRDRTQAAVYAHQHHYWLNLQSN